MPALQIRVGDRQVGSLEALEDSNYCFIFDRGWLSDPERPVLGQLFEDRRPAHIYTSGMLCWFAHLLPQGRLRRLITTAAGIPRDDDFELLRVCGGDLPGAVIALDGSTQMARAEVSLPPPSSKTNADLLAFSLAGNQWKISVREGERGLVIPTRGQAGQWIAKFHDPELARLPQVEYATTILAQRCGLMVPEVRMASASEFERLPEALPLGDGMVFLSRRFDRSAAARIHMEDLAQVLDRPPPDIYSGTYEEVAAIVMHLCPADVDRFIEQLLFCVIVGNGDAHLKNWSIQYPDGRNPRLSPAYDLVPTVVYYRPGRENLALSLGGSKDFANLDISRFDHLGSVLGRELPRFHQNIVARVTRMWDILQRSVDDVGFDERELAALRAHAIKMVNQLTPR